jgi:hypothetical protein
LVKIVPDAAAPPEFVKLNALYAPEEANVAVATDADTPKSLPLNVSALPVASALVLLA